MIISKLQYDRNRGQELLATGIEPKLIMERNS